MVKWVFLGGGGAEPSTAVVANPPLCIDYCLSKHSGKWQPHEWVLFFDTWEMCDSFCMQIFKYSDLSWNKITEWSTSEHEYIKRAAYAIMATYGQGHKEMPNEQYDCCYPLILRDATDPRNFVKKAINWAIREIGKRNVDLQNRCIELCHELLEIADKTASWIAKDALRELEEEGVRIRNYPRSIYS